MDTQTETDKKKPTVKPPQLADLGAGIPIKFINFNRPNGVDLPNDHYSVSHIRAGKCDHGSYALAWLPQVRAIRIEYVARQVERKSKGGTLGGCTFFVPESWVTWEV
jgi:hypothetical protein